MSRIVTDGGGRNGTRNWLPRRPQVDVTNNGRLTKCGYISSPTVSIQVVKWTEELRPFVSRLEIRLGVLQVSLSLDNEIGGGDDQMDHGADTVAHFGGGRRGVGKSIAGDVTDNGVFGAGRKLAS